MSERQEVYLKLTQIFDGLMLGGVLWLAHALRQSWGELFDWIRPIPDFERFFWLIAIIVPIGPIVLEFQGFYNHPLRKKAGEAVAQVGRALMWMALIFGLCVIFLKWSAESRSVLLLFMGAGGLALLLRERLVKLFLLRRSEREEYRQRIVLAGDAEGIREILDKMPDDERLRVQVVDQVDLNTRPASDLAEIFRRRSVERVVFAADHVNFRTVEQAIHVCETEGVEAWLAADFMHPTISRMRVDLLGSSPMLVFRSTPDNGWALFLKEMIDRIGGAVLILLTAPVWLAAAVGVKLASPDGPVIFRQKRSGRYGKPFTMWKFRTMHPEAETRRGELNGKNEMTGPAFKLKDDPRIFPFGALLRKSSIDELPQLWNVVCGDMSLVGPRPLPVFEVEKIEDSAQRRRLSVKPGLTCLWQISGRNTIHSFEDWVSLDLEYIDNWSLWLDWKILARTIPAVLAGTGAR